MISLEDVKKLSNLCKIHFDENELDEFLSKLKNVVKLIDQLQEVDTDGVEPLTSIEGQRLRLRKDVVTEGGIEEELFSNVPGDTASLAKEIKCFIVPKMVE